MLKTVVLNAGKLNFDDKLDFSSLKELTEVMKYPASNGPEILVRVKDQNIIITKELPLGNDLISQFPSSVKLICEAGTGYNNIGLEAAKEKNITVCNVPGYSTQSVAQLAIGFILNLSSSLSRQQVMIKQKNYDNFSKHLQVPHFEVQGKTLGIIGAGSIGRSVINVAISLGMNVLAYNRTPKQWDNPKVKPATLEEVLQLSDFVSIHCPLTPATKHLIDEDCFKLMKTSAYIINTSRGAIIKETALIKALKNKEIAGAALDVQDPEPPQLNNPLFDMDNVLLTPHIGWQTLEARQRLIHLLAGNIRSFIEGTPVNVVN